MSDLRVSGFCPMGCGSTLFVGEGGHITCSWEACPDPAAVDSIIQDSEAEHIVQIGEETFTVRHPLRERIDDALLVCELHSWLHNLDGPSVKSGRYRATPTRDGWAFAEAP